uniref:Salivary glue protein Sgs-8 n=2 Tax=Drosophila melanogaster TaxID=7227 RepID=SGS8_DROME|nr:salivary gland secretion 8 [Drosophila melanogaster]P02842.1 RecName: Full=Salivary glue protein Sgs-8; Flags: Precursor [Drosophila melanogaster]AAF50059.1 salivary gland secretion 8 [Drosophila melanogaster]AOQ10558.1 Sgs8-RA [synthetic construct]|eukprot:NP_476719.2 salivary gland secretion 8 [Drosophila melanogaster]
MKLLVVAVIACIMLIGFADPASGCKDCSCVICGPGGEPCPGCSARVPVCKDLINIMEGLERQVRQCACGEQVWLF